MIRAVKVDEKGRILIPKEMRERAGIKDSAKIELDEGKIIVQANSLLDELTKYPLAFSTKDLHKLRQKAFAQGLKEVQKDREQQ
jgi:AbrB family looped-hinge helix DNA binding protein